MELHNPIFPINLRKFIDLFIGDAQYRALPDLPIAQLIKLLDPTEECCHIEFPNTDNMLEAPILWHKHHWMNEYARIQKVRAQSDKNREAWLIRREYLKQIIRAYMKLMGLTQEEVLPLAIKVIKDKNIILAKQLGVDITDMPDAPSRTPEII